MLTTALRTGTACVILTAALGIVLAQDSVQKGVPKSGSTSALRAKSIIGSKVQIQGNTGVGTVEDIVIDQDGVIDYFIVSDGGKMVTVPWEAAKFNFEKRTAVINITQEQYRSIPTYTPDQYPEFYTPAYQTQINKYYGITPAQERRFERRVIRK